MHFGCLSGAFINVESQQELDARLIGIADVVHESAVAVTHTPDVLQAPARGHTISRLLVDSRQDSMPWRGARTSRIDATSLGARRGMHACYAQHGAAIVECNM